MSVICSSSRLSWEAANKPFQIMFDWSSNFWMNAALAVAWFSSVIEPGKEESPNNAPLCGIFDMQ